MGTLMSIIEVKSWEIPENILGKILRIFDSGLASDYRALICYLSQIPTLYTIAMAAGM